MLDAVVDAAPAKGDQRDQFIPDLPVLGEHVEGQGMLGQSPDGLVDLVQGSEGHHRQNRAENFLLHHRIIQAHVGHDRGTDV